MDSSSIFTALSSSVLALLISLYVVPLMMRAAVSLNILDRPDQNLKRHREPTPYLGGMAIFLALLFSLSLILKLDAFSSAFFLGAAMIVTIGFVDDMKALSPKLKFFLQFLTVFVVIRGGVHHHRHPPLGQLPSHLPLAPDHHQRLQLLDIMDGLAATIGPPPRPCSSLPPSRETTPSSVSLPPSSEPFSVSSPTTFPGRRSSSAIPGAC